MAERETRLVINTKYCYMYIIRVTTIMVKNFETRQKGDNPPSSPLFNVEGSENITDSTLKRVRKGRGRVCSRSISPL